MEARSYLENIANRTTMRGVVAVMTRLMFLVTLLGAVGLLVVTGFHPAAIIISAVLLVFSAILARDAVIMRRTLREEPLDLAFDPAPNRGLVSPGTIFGTAAGLVLFGGVFGVVTWLGNTTAATFWPLGILVIGLALAVVGVPTLGVQQRKWRVLSDALAAHPDLVTYLQDARARFPASAPFPFSAPTDSVSIP